KREVEFQDRHKALAGRDTDCSYHKMPPRATNNDTTSRRNFHLRLTAGSSLYFIAHQPRNSGADVDMKKNSSDTKKSSSPKAKTASRPANAKKPGDWRGTMLVRLRSLIEQADPDVVEVVKWRKPSNAMRGVPVWEHDGIICTGETYKAVVKLT